MSGIILVTGATGNVGREVVKQLAARGVAARAAVYDEADARRTPADAAETARFDFLDPTTFPSAFAGVDEMFLMRPPAISNVKRDIQPAIEYAARAGVSHIVFLSLIGVERNRIVPHAKIEKLLVASGIPWTMLRCGFFMQNLNTTHRADIVESGDIFIPAGGGRTAFIDARDIGAVAARVLTEPGQGPTGPVPTGHVPTGHAPTDPVLTDHANTAYKLTGSEALTYEEVAAIMTEELGRPITYSDPSALAFARRFRERGYTSGYVNVMLGIYLTTRLGMASGISPDAERLLGRPPITMREYIRDYAKAFES